MTKPKVKTTGGTECCKHFVPIAAVCDQCTVLQRFGYESRYIGGTTLALNPPEPAGTLYVRSYVTTDEFDKLIVMDRADGLAFIKSKQRRGGKYQQFFVDPTDANTGRAGRDNSKAVITGIELEQLVTQAIGAGHANLTAVIRYIRKTLNRSAGGNRIRDAFAVVNRSNVAVEPEQIESHPKPKRASKKKTARHK